MHTIDEILQILDEVKPGLDAGEHDELVKTGLLDSVDIMGIVMAISEEFDLEVTTLDLKEENFHTAAAMLALVNRLEEE